MIDGNLLLEIGSGARVQNHTSRPHYLVLEGIVGNPAVKMMRTRSDGRSGIRGPFNSAEI